MTSHDHTELYAKVGEHLDRAQHVLLLNPEGGDGDSFGSTLAFANHLAQRNKRYAVLSHRAVRKMFTFLPRFEEVRTNATELDLLAFDLIIGVDFADTKMTGIEKQLRALDRTRCPVVNIDHHPTNTQYGDINIVDPQSAAASEIVFGLFHHHGWHIDKHIATCLLTGIMTDTSNFSNRNTTKRSLEIAATLLRHGARMRTITDFTYRNKTVGALRLWGKALARLQHNADTGLVTTFITQQDFAECGVGEEAAGGVANFLNKLEGAKAVLVLRELDDGRIKGSFRTTGDEVNVAELAGAFGGGGHRRAAGFTIKGRIQEVDGVWKVV